MKEGIEFKYFLRTVTQVSNNIEAIQDYGDLNGFIFLSQLNHTCLQCYCGFQ